MSNRPAVSIVTGASGDDNNNTSPVAGDEQGDSRGESLTVSPQLPLEALQKSNRNVRSWTDDVVNRGSATNRPEPSTVLPPASACSAPPSTAGTAMGRSCDADDRDPLGHTLGPEVLLHTRAGSSACLGGMGSSFGVAEGSRLSTLDDEEMLPLNDSHAVSGSRVSVANGSMLVLRADTSLPPPSAGAATLLPPLHSRASSSVNASLVSREVPATGGVANPPPTRGAGNSSSSNNNSSSSTPHRQASSAVPLVGGPAVQLPSGPSVREVIQQTLLEQQQRRRAQQQQQQQGMGPDSPTASSLGVIYSNRAATLAATLPPIDVNSAAATTDRADRYATIVTAPAVPRATEAGGATDGVGGATGSATASAIPSVNSITRLYRPTPVTTATVKSNQGPLPFEDDYDLYGGGSCGSSLGDHDVVSLAADLGRAPRLTRQHLQGLSSAEDGASTIGGGTSSYGGWGGIVSSTAVPGIELCFDNLTIEAKNDYFMFGTRRDLGATRAEYASSYAFSAATIFSNEGSRRDDFYIPNADGGVGGPRAAGAGAASGGSRWSFLWSSFQKGVAVQNVTGLFATRGLHVVFCPDRFVGSTMLRSLAGLQRRSNTIVSGVALGNGLPVASSVFREHRTFVSTSEMCIRDATVAENLAFAVKMRVDTAYTDLLILKAAEWTCLSSYLDVKVQHLRPAQVYMLAVAMELVLDPSVLFLSYPLDDLNISDQGEVIGMLRKLSRRKSIVVSLDTMPFALSEGITQILLLSREGKMIFSGSPDGLQSFLSKLKREDTVVAGRKGRKGTAEASSGGDNSSPDQGSPHAVVNMKQGGNKGASSSGSSNVVQYGFYGGICNAVDLVRLWEAENLIPQVVQAFTQTSEFKTLKAAVAEHKQKATRSGVDGGFQRVPRTVPPPPSWIKRNALLMHYLVRTTLLRTDFLFSWLFLVVSFVACISLGDSQSSDQGGMQNLRGIIFFLLNCVVHVNVMFVESESLERESFSHLRNNRYFNGIEFYVATMIRLFIPRLLFSFITALFAKMIFVAASPLGILAGLTSFTHALLVLLMVYVWPRPQDVVIVQLLYYAYSVVFCGFLINIKSIPTFFSALSLLRPGYGGAISHVLRNQPYSCENFLDLAHNVTVTAYCYTGDQYLELQGFSHDGLGINSAQLSIIAGVLMVLILFCMLLF